MTDKKQGSFTLPKKKVKVKPIPRKGKWLQQGHSGHFLYDNTTITLRAPLSEKTGGIVNPLTKQEQDFFENPSLSGLDYSSGDLSPHKDPKNNVWAKFAVQIKKPSTIVDENSVLLELDLSNPKQYLQYKVLLANAGPGGMVAPSYKERLHRPSYRIVVVEEDHEQTSKSIRGDKLSEAYTYFNKIKDSAEQMYDFLSIIYLLDNASSRPPADGKKAWFKAKIQDLIDSPKLDLVLEVIRNEEEYDNRLFVHRAIANNDIVYKADGFELIDGKPIGDSLTDAIKFFKDDRNNEIKMKIQAKLEDNE